MYSVQFFAIQEESSILDSELDNQFGNVSLYNNLGAISGEALAMHSYFSP